VGGGVGVGVTTTGGVGVGVTTTGGGVGVGVTTTGVVVGVGVTTTGGVGVADDVGAAEGETDGCGAALVNVGVAVTVARFV
jgi:hypothetical protein